MIILSGKKHHFDCSDQLFSNHLLLLFFQLNLHYCRKSIDYRVILAKTVDVMVHIVTTCNNAGRQAVFDRNESYGNDLVYVRTNATARPKCYPWQGKVISMNDNGRTVHDQRGNAIRAYGISETSYGQPDGLWGINCHHGPPNVFIEGWSNIRGNENMPDAEENERRYELTQKQRKMERDVRYAKREAAMLDAAGDQEGFEKAALEVKKRQSVLNSFGSITKSV